MQDSALRFTDLLTRLSIAEGYQATAIPGVALTKFSRTDQQSKRRWRACLAIVAQGCKEIVLGQEVYRGGTGWYTATPVDLPVISQVTEASPARPFVAVLIDLEPFALREITLAMDKEAPTVAGAPQRAMFVGRADEKMLAAAVRLAELLHHPEDAPVLGPLVVKELFYWLLKGPNGPALRQFLRAGSKLHQIVQAIHRLKSALSEDVDVTALAQEANMSRSAFFKGFHEVTALSPIQYQKRLRLLEARRLMLEAGETAESAAFRVGYRSASQFSREYSRMFGQAPMRDAVQIKAAGRGADWTEPGQSETDA